MIDFDYVSTSIIQNIDIILELFGVPYRKNDKRITASCPIHKGDGKNNFSIYLSEKGSWKCWSHNCDNEWGCGMISFMKAMLFTYEGHKDPKFMDVVRWLEKHLQISLKDKKINSTVVSTRKFVSLVNKYKKQQKEIGYVTRDYVRQFLKIPAEYYIKRGYSPAILDRYDVGLCDDPTKPMFNRIIVPLYGLNSKYIIGYTGRSIFEECKKCRMYHNPQEECSEVPKWRNSFNFKGESYLYNYSNAAEEIKECRAAILVEGPGDVWKLEDSDIGIGLGLMRCKPTDSQRLLLDNLGVMTLYVVLDSDTEGQKMADELEAKYHKYYNIEHLVLPKKDFGEMTKEEIKQFMYPILEKM